MKFKMTVKQSREVEVEVECDTYPEAYIAAEERARASLGIDANFHHSVLRAVQLGEPWIDCCGWYDLHKPDDIIVVNRAPGNIFTAKDITLLRKRLVGIGLKVVEHWNGAMSSTVSFRCKGRRGSRPLSKRKLAKLLAPRS